ncbi:GNAT family N-acetyltransferase [Tenacibaculum jejuense]|uniref:Acetyltransferase, GNAT family n=1 Tax=Tenacibaculum jejuense TaxID=584609 RepID=A0A238UE66_9FLAO|nr:GNAT family N-acetyltransferase [Tenacibaculum jejuense]SNR17382.1 Acetyltransferase, GNAT family [Tenacibaculum jejuense]
MKSEKIIIETERLIVREFVLDDYKDVYEFNSNVELHQFTGDEIIASEERAKEIIQDIWFQDYENYGYGRWAVLYKPKDKVIGFAGLKFLPEINETDIGFRFLPEYWGKGIASEVAKEIIKFGFENLNLNRIIGIAMPQNIGSCKVLEKIGLTFLKLDTYDHGSEFYNWYALDKVTYEDKKGK